MEFSSLKSLSKVYPLAVQKYEQFVPNASEQDIVTKVNSLIVYLNNIGKLSNDTANQWNNVMKWILADGLTESVDKKIVELLSTGQFEELLQTAIEEINIDTNARLDGFDTTLSEKANQKHGNLADSLGKVEGFPTNQYKYTLGHSQEVSDTLNRYWSVIGDVIVPIGSISKQDHLGVRGQAITEAPETRIWGSAFLASLLPTSKPLDNDKQKLPSVIGTEIDVNNSSGLDMTDLSYQEIIGLLIASGGSNQPFAGWVVQKAPTAGKWFTGGFFKDNSIQYGIMFDDVNPNNAFYFTDSYNGGSIISTKDNTNLLEVRLPDGLGQLIAIDKQFQWKLLDNGMTFNNKSGVQVAKIGNDGVFEAKQLKNKFVIVTNGATSIDASSGNVFATVNGSATSINSIINGVGGQEITLIMTDNNTTIQYTSNIKLKDGVNYVATNNDTIKLVCDGVNWFETSRSVNGL